jgi:hypothetical protein
MDEQDLISPESSRNFPKPFSMPRLKLAGATLQFLVEADLDGRMAFERLRVQTRQCTALERDQLFEFGEDDVKGSKGG